MFSFCLFVCFKKKAKNVYRPLYTRTIYPTFGLLPFFVSFLPLNFFCSYFLLHYFRYETNPQKTIKNRRVQAIYRKFFKNFHYKEPFNGKYWTSLNGNWIKLSKKSWSTSDVVTKNECIWLVAQHNDDKSSKNKILHNEITVVPFNTKKIIAKLLSMW